MATSLGSLHEFWAAWTQLYESTLGLEEKQRHTATSEWIGSGRKWQRWLGLWLSW